MSEILKVEAAESEMPASNKVEVKLECVGKLNYAAYLMDKHIVKKCTVINLGDQKLEGLVLKISMEPAVIDPITRALQPIEPKGQMKLVDLNPVPKLKKMDELTDKCSGNFLVEVYQGEEQVYANAVPVDIQTLDTWPSYTVGPQSIACFVCANSKLVQDMQAKVPAVLAKDPKHNYDPSQPAYYWKDPVYAENVGRADFAVFQEEQFPYAVSPADQQLGVQRVRLPHKILKNRLVNCVESSCTYAGLLRANGLYPILVGVRGHMMVGFWLYENKEYPAAVCKDVNVILQHIAAGNLVVLDITMATAGSKVKFEQARDAAEKQLKEPGNFQYFVDIHYAHHHGIPPIPTPPEDDEKEPRAADPADEDRADVEPAVFEPVGAEPVEPDIVPADLSPEEMKLMRWEQELMNLGLSNNLLNLKNKGTLPVYASDLDALVEALYEPCRLLHRPEEWDKKNWSFDNLILSQENYRSLNEELNRKRLRCAVDAAALEKTVMELNRAAEKSNRESGIHTLYLASGLLRWQDTDRNGKTCLCHAPVMLYPVELGRQNNQPTVRITGPGEVNETLVEKLRKRVKLDLRGLADREGAAPRTPGQVLRYLKKAIVGYQGALVLDVACVGHFTFRTDAQYTELRDNREAILDNCVCRSLVKGQLQWNAQRLEKEGVIRWDAEEPIVTRNLDEYQMRVVKYSQNQEAFLVFGPPGCGKSTTLAATIKNAMAQGKRVLFVAYQSEAQDAIYKELQKDGLESYALVLRMGNAGKRYAVRQLSRAAQRENSHPKGTDYQLQRSKTSRARETVQTYYDDLFTRGNCGQSLYELIDSYEEVRRDRGIRKEALADPEHLTADRLEQQERLLDRILYAASQLKPSQHPLKGLNCSGATAEQITQIQEKLDEYTHTLNALSQSAELFALRLDTQPPKTYQGLARLTAFAREILPWKDLPHEFGGRDPADYYRELQQMADDHMKVQQLQQKLLRSYNREFVQDDADDLLRAWEEAGCKPSRKLLSRVKKYTSQALTRDSLAAPLEQLSQIRQLEERCRTRFARYGSSLGLSNAQDTDWSQEKLRLEQCLDRWYAQSARYSSEMLQAAVENCSLAQDCVRYWDAATNECPEFVRISQTGEDWVRQTLARCRELKGNLYLLPKWTVWNDLREQAQIMNMGIIPDILEQEAVDPDTLRKGYRKAVHRALMEHAIARSDALSGYQDVLFKPALDEVHAQKEKLMELARDEIVFRLENQIDLTQESVNGQEAALFQRWVKNTGSLSLRKLFEAAPNVVKKLCPCIIANPEALATYLPYRAGEFDLVVFDEASQLTPAESVAAISRGKEPKNGGSLVICGDPQQMPPSRYFAGSQSDDGDDLHLVELESVLDETIALNMPAALLMHHYRSKEDLIAFSNHAFYDGKLITMPGVSDGESHLKLIQVDGVYGRGGSRCNPAEAEAVVEELKRRCRDDKSKHQSVGIITMNVQQQALVEKLLGRACDEDKELTAWLQSAREKLFVQNLESVQGTERDVILLSLNYGPGEDGKLSLSMGPLTREGGYRRFNVAISRAREEMQVYASLRAEDISAHKTSARGVLALRDFLRYARTGVLPDSEGSAQIRKSGRISNSIFRALTEAGYTVKQDLGSSAFRINLAVVDQEDESRYQLGIVLDEPGNLDRDEMVSLLEHRGWKIHRIHAMDWYRGPELVIRELLDKLGNAA